MSRTIPLIGTGLHKEAPASEAITPGMLIIRQSNGMVKKHATAGGAAAKAFALEIELAGKGIDTAYASGDLCFYSVFHSGEEVNALVAASATAILIGDALESAGDGTLRKGTTVILAYSLSAVDNSAGATAVRVYAEVA